MSSITYNTIYIDAAHNVYVKAQRVHRWIVDVKRVFEQPSVLPTPCQAMVEMVKP